MAIFHHTTQAISRSAGRSAVACAAYRSGETIRDDRLGETFKLGVADRVVHTEIIAPAGTPAWALDRSTLWNRVEAGEKRKDAQVAREVEAALPDELNHHQHLAIVRAYVARALTPSGVVVDAAFHTSQRKDRPKNPHVHFMETMRAVVGDGFGPKLRALNDRAEVVRRRAIWAECVNEALAEAGHAARIDHRSNAERGIGDEPTIKEGAGARGRADRGQVSERVDTNAAIRARNAKRRHRQAEVLANQRRPLIRPTRSKETAHHGNSPAVRTADAKSAGRRAIDVPKRYPVLVRDRAGSSAPARMRLRDLPVVAVADRLRPPAQPVRPDRAPIVRGGGASAGVRHPRAVPAGRGSLTAQAVKVAVDTKPAASISERPRVGPEPKGGLSLAARFLARITGRSR
jgi:hypothetical protein